MCRPSDDESLKMKQETRKIDCRWALLSLPLFNFHDAEAQAAPEMLGTGLTKIHSRVV
jgi:hypothetical protein